MYKTGEQNTSRPYILQVYASLYTSAEKPSTYF